MLAGKLTIRYVVSVERENGVSEYGGLTEFDEPIDISMYQDGDEQDNPDYPMELKVEEDNLKHE